MTMNDWTAYYQKALEPQLQPDVTYEEYRENARQQLERDRGAFTGEAPRSVPAEVEMVEFTVSWPHTYVGTLTWAEVV